MSPNLIINILEGKAIPIKAMPGAGRNGLRILRQKPRYGVRKEKDMIYYQLLRDNSGTVISSYNAGTINTITTESVETERTDGECGLLFVLAGGTAADLARQVSFDNVNFYNVFDSNGTNLSNLSTNILNSRFVLFNNINSSNVIAPWTRFTFVGTGTITTLTLYYAQKE